METASCPHLNPFFLSMKNHTVMIERIVRPQSFFLVMEGIKTPHNLTQVPFVKLSELLECINADCLGVRIFAPDIFGAYAHLAHGDEGMTWISSLEYEIDGDRVPTEFRCEIYIPESWSDNIIHIVSVHRFLERDCASSIPIQVTANS